MPRQPLTDVQAVHYGPEPAEPLAPVLAVPGFPELVVGRPTVHVSNHDGSATEPPTEE